MNRLTFGAVVLAMMIWTEGCEQKAAAPKATATPSAKPPSGYGPYKLGMAFEDLLATPVGDRLNGYGLRECLDEVALRGCFVSTDADKVAVERRNGIPYQMSFGFNRLNKLTDIDLRFEREGDVSADECLNIHERTLDWLSKEYGAFVATSDDKPEKGTSIRRTPDGQPYLVGSIDKGSFMTGIARNVGRSTAASRREAVGKWDNDRYASLMTSYLDINGTFQCGVNVSISEPLSVERRIYRQGELPPASKAKTDDTVRDADERTLPDDVGEVPVCDRPDSTSKRALMKEIGTDCLGE